MEKHVGTKRLPTLLSKLRTVVSSIQFAYQTLHLRQRPLTHPLTWRFQTA